MKSVVKIVIGIALTVALVTAIIITVVVVVRLENNKCAVPNQPHRPSIYKYDKDILISWFDGRPNTECPVTYRLQYSIGDGENLQSDITGTFYTIPDLNLEPCSVLLVRIWAIGEDGSSSIPNANDYSEIPSDLHLTNFEYNDVDDGLLVTWNKSIGLIRCQLRYSLSMYSDLDVFFTDPVSERAIIPDHKYCFQMSIIIFARLNVDSTYTTDKPNLRGKIDKIQIEVAPDNSDELIISWENHPKEDLCSLEYHVEYSSDVSIDDQSLIVTNPEARFKFTYCVEATVQILTYGLNGTTMGPYAIVDATQYPEYRLHINMTNKETAISHESIPQTDTCNVTYLAIITTDLGNFTYSTESIIESLEGSYCFYRRFQIHPVTGDHVGQPAIVELRENLAPVENLELVAEGSSGILIATWASHPKRELCGIEYVVTYGDSRLNQTTITKETSMSFDISYCTAAFVIVEAISGDVISESRLVRYNTGSPMSIEKIQNVRVDNTGIGFITVIWQSPEHLNLCDITYTVTATHPVAGTTTCSGFSSCDITLSNFCPSTYLVIVATSLDGQIISGEPSSQIYLCY